MSEVALNDIDWDTPAREGGLYGMSNRVRMEREAIVRSMLLAKDPEAFVQAIEEAVNAISGQRAAVTIHKQHAVVGLSR